MLALKIVLGISLSCIFIFCYASFVYIYWGLGVSESLKLILTGSIIDHHNKSKLQAGNLVLLKTKAGYYPSKITSNNMMTKSIRIETDTFMGWESWNYKDIEVLDSKAKKILYGRENV